jgi:hypothetical protein
MNLIAAISAVLLLSSKAVAAFAAPTATLTFKRSTVLKASREVPRRSAPFTFLGAYPAIMTRGGADLAARFGSTLASATETPSALFNSALLTLAATTVAIKIAQRSSPRSKDITKKVKPKSIQLLQMRFLGVFWLIRCADWLQGPYFYEVYASKVFNGVQASLGLVSKLFLTGFASTALFGPLVGRAADTYGRKRGTLAFVMLYAMGALSTKSGILSVLLLGRVLSGIGTSLLFSAPESWLVGEAQKGGDDPDGSYLGETFGMVSPVCIACKKCQTLVGTYLFLTLNMLLGIRRRCNSCHFGWSVCWCSSWCPRTHWPI